MLKNKNIKYYLSTVALKIVFFIFVFLSCTCNLFAISASDVATIDYQLVFNLHPKMTLFDLNRIGFYKVKLGLSYDEFQKEIDSLKTNPKDNSEEIRKTEEELKKLSSEASDFQKKYINDLKNMRFYSKKFYEYEFKKNQLLQRLNDLKWESGNADLSSRDETKVIKEEILKEIIDAVKEVVREKKYALVLNTSIIVPYRFDYKSFCIHGCHGIPGINLNLFLGFDYINRVVKQDFSKDNSFKYKKWQSLTGIKDDKLPVSNHSMVLSGGNSITKDVLTVIYKKYNFDEKYINIVCSVIDRIETLQNGKELEKMVVLDGKK